MFVLPKPLEAFRAFPQFVCWFATPKPGTTKHDKFPCRWDTGAVVNALDPVNWCEYDVAAMMAETWDRGHGCGVGFVFTANDPFFFLDIDNCWDDATGWSPLAMEIMRKFTGAAVEVSHSGRGLHIFGTIDKTNLPPHSNRNKALGLEFYTKDRFVALTGQRTAGDAGAKCFH